ncbi:MAG: hypothetical protein WKF36_03530 [Candidatus Nitrosocosmicus sp.]
MKSNARVSNQFARVKPVNGDHQIQLHEMHRQKQNTLLTFTRFCKVKAIPRQSASITPLYKVKPAGAKVEEGKISVRNPEPQKRLFFPLTPKKRFRLHIQ